MGAYIINVPSTVDRIIYVHVDANTGKTAVVSQQMEDLTPYTEPDLEQVRLEAEQLGMVRAWGAARKIWEYDTTTLKAIFGEGIMRMDWFMNLTAAEAIEKLKAYEQEQEEIKVGDEVAFHHDDGRPDTVVVVTYIGQDGFIDGMDGRGTQYAHKNPKKWTKTGRHFTEIDSVLEKMRGEQDG